MCRTFAAGVTGKQRLSFWLCCGFSIAVLPGIIEPFFSALDESTLDDSRNPDEESVPC
jgi:hypothetical protein